MDEPDKPEPDGGHGWKVLSSVPYDQAPPTPAAALAVPVLPSDDTSTL